MSKKILVVDDDKDTRKLLAYLLEKSGYEVITSHSGEDAIEKVKNEKPDIMLLDLIMPGMDGMEVLRRVRHFDYKIGIIMVTAVKDESIGKNALKKGADEYITKPVDFKYLESGILANLVKKDIQGRTK